jgi:hypothetical protein
VSAGTLLVNGSLDIASGSLLSLADLAGGSAVPFADNTIFALINYTGTWNGGVFTYNGSPLTDGSRFAFGGRDWDINYASPTGGVNFTGDYASGSFVTITAAVPEPSTWAMARELLRGNERRSRKSERACAGSARVEVAARLWEVATPIPHARRKARRRASP